MNTLMAVDVPPQTAVDEACGDRANLLQFVPIPSTQQGVVVSGWRWNGTVFVSPGAVVALPVDTTDRSAADQLVYGTDNLP